MSFKPRKWSLSGASVSAKLASRRAKTKGTAGLGQDASYDYTLWGEKPAGWGYASGQAFGLNPLMAAIDALEDAKAWQKSKFKLPARIDLQTGPKRKARYTSFRVGEDGSITPLRLYRATPEEIEAMKRDRAERLKG
jgi:hypothetical protein